MGIQKTRDAKYPMTPERGYTKFQCSRSGAWEPGNEAKLRGSCDAV